MHGKDGLITDRALVRTMATFTFNIYTKVLNPKVLHLPYTRVCNGLHETACDTLWLDIARLPDRPAANEATAVRIGNKASKGILRKYAQSTFKLPLRRNEQQIIPPKG